MNIYDPNKPLISIHIPKCGGTTFRQILEQWFGKRLHYHYYDERSCSMPEAATIRKQWTWLHGKQLTPACIHGHFNRHRGFGISDYYPDIRQFISFVRDPLEVQVSYYFFVNKKSPTMGGVSRYIDKPLHGYLEDFIEQGRSWYLSYFPDYFNEDNCLDLIQEQFVFLGVTELYQQSLSGLAHALGKKPTSFSVRNVTKRDRYEISDELIERFRERFAMDYRIYDFACQTVQALPDDIVEMSR